MLTPDRTDDGFFERLRKISTFTAQDRVYYHLAITPRQAAYLAELTGKRCVWDVWGTSAHMAGCSRIVVSDNIACMRFCPYCGGRIEVEGEK
jgi:hypothetical protein